MRNILERALYMHAGQFGDLVEVMRFYDRGFVRRTTLSPEMANVRARGTRDILAFLATLTSPTAPNLVLSQEALDRQTAASDHTSQGALATPPR